MQGRKAYKHSSKTTKQQDPIKNRLQANQSRNVKQKEMKNVTEIKEHNLENLNEEEINKIIQQSRAAKKHYAKTDIDDYEPLTKKQKIKVLEDLNDASDKRILLYSKLFKEIKTQINSLSNISTQSPRSKLQTTQQLKHFVEGIKEVEDSSDDDREVYNRDLDSPGNPKYAKGIFKSTSKNIKTKLMNPTQSRGLFDWRDSEENVGLIHIPQMNYKSNSLKTVDLVSGHKFSTKYETVYKL
jgi:hypothetical protein